MFKICGPLLSVNLRKPVSPHMAQKSGGSYYAINLQYCQNSYFLNRNLLQATMEKYVKKNGRNHKRIPEKCY